METYEWLRRRIRMYIRKSWKKPTKKKANLIKSGIPNGDAYEWGKTRL